MFVHSESGNSGHVGELMRERFVPLGLTAYSLRRSSVAVREGDKVTKWMKPEITHGY